MGVIFSGREIVRFGTDFVNSQGSMLLIPWRLKVPYNLSQETSMLHPIFRIARQRNGGGGAVSCLRSQIARSGCRGRLVFVIPGVANRVVIVVQTHAPATILPWSSTGYA